MVYRELKEALFPKDIPFVQKLQDHIYRLRNFDSGAEKVIRIYGKSMRDTHWSDCTRFEPTTTHNHSQPLSL